MSVEKKILTTFRIIEALPKIQDRMKATVEKLNKILTPQDKKSMEQVLKTMILLTAGNQKAIRNPETFDPSSATENWSALGSVRIFQFYEALGLKYDLFAKPTKADYELAHKLLPIIGSASITKDDIDAQIGPTGDIDRRFASEGHSVVYRGLKNMDSSVITFLMTKPVWDMTRGVSTSHEKLESERFATVRDWGAKSGPSVMFTINNVSKRGFNAGELSRYSREKEVILSGNLQVGDWVVEAKGDILSPDGDREGIKIEINSQNETVSFARLFPGSREPLIKTQTFPNDFNESFSQFAASLIETEGGVIVIDDEDWEVEVNKSSILIKANAILK
jgi:hypothetical protein